MTKPPQTPLRDPGRTAACTCFNLRKASRAVTQAFDAALEPAGLRATQFSLLGAAAVLDAPTISRLADAMVMDRTTLTRNLRPLLKEGLIETAAGDDRRSRHVRLTARGRAKLAEAEPLWRQAQTRLVEGLGPAAWSRLLDGLDAAVDAAQGR